MHEVRELCHTIIHYTIDTNQVLLYIYKIEEGVLLPSHSHGMEDILFAREEEGIELMNDM